MSELKQTPSQTVGPFFAYGLCPEQYNFDFKSLFTANAAEPHAAGEHIIVMGKVYDGSGAAVGDAIVESLQADASGHYVASQEEASARGFTGFCRVGTGTEQGNAYVIRTLKPGPVAPGAAPCIDIILHMRGMLLHAFTRLYFEDEPEANEGDAVLGRVPAERRRTLIAKLDPDSSVKLYRFDIHLQGPDETVFFDY
ncbi:protocatechuate 3,4-dioxygenase subunit alpha [Achromobacter sp. Root83]|uniref:protocatechuate 3,4-dioxygenase subunit alpha n=1 Tax=Achromobacter sp. Root83 TaxID=1736602 RepID=UPI00070A8390|nr:protocatechuate 3,4-dioxygenase subunit alpha [Achromobacter sp. Root83]KRC77855.1 protocatechuate 3,4-dioxygenase subunit alpha [Achromobacter sp. Root83]